MPQPKTVTETRPLDWFRPDERELARHDDPDAIRRLGQDMLANGQLQAVGATEDGRMIFGHGRLLAAKSAGIKSLEVKLYPSSISDTQFRLIRAAENLQRKDLTGYQKWLLCADLMCGNPTWQQKDLAQAMNLSEKMITVNLSPSRCTPAWQEALKEGKVGISDCYQASLLPEAEQAGLLAFKLSGDGGKKVSRNKLAEAARKARNGSTPAVKQARVVCPLTTGTKIVVTGPEMSLQDLIESLSSALESARKASRESIDVKTWSRVMADKAKVGANHD